MAPIAFNSIKALEENTTEAYFTCTEVLLRIAGNILKEPKNPKYRSISLGSSVVMNKLLPAAGAMQCLFEMGFQEGTDKLVLPPESPLDSVKYIHDELIKRREIKRIKKSNYLEDKKSTENSTLNLIVKELKTFMSSFNNDFFHGFIDNIYDIWKCENINVQLKALKCIPLVELKKNVERIIRQVQKSIKKKEIEDQIIDYQELLLMELCKWFKSDFFQWVDKPECMKCGNRETSFINKESSRNQSGSVIEVYKCSLCNETTSFPRYRDAEQLLNTRRGRCGEWAKCFYLICRSLGWDVRFVVDATDHVWTEIYSDLNKRWIHCDPCETVIDAPLIYENGWRKKLSYIVAYSKDEIQDVTWRYSSNHSAILKNRKKCSEEDFVYVICSVRKILLNFASPRRREYVTRRAAFELVELLQQKTVTEVERKGRSSGSLAWRLQRGEFTFPEEFRPWIWKLEKIDKESLQFVLSYCTSLDEYDVDGTGEKVKGWKNGLFQMSSVFRKEEHDWKMAYLARKEGTDKGTLTWRFETDHDYVIGNVQLDIISQIYESGQVICRMSNDTTAITVPNGKTSFTTSSFSGSKHMELSVILSGGCGDNAWQHAQLLRQPFDEYGKTLKIIINLIPC